MSFLSLVGAVLGGFNCILLGAVIFILKQPDPSRGKVSGELAELGERLAELNKSLSALEKRIDKNINDSKNENIAKLDRLTKDVGRQLKDIHDNL